MNLLIVGATGQLALSLAEKAAQAGIRTLSGGRPDLDLSRPEAELDLSLSRLLDLAEFDVVINAAAYTAVDRAETEAHQAHAINAAGAGRVAAMAARRGLPVIHMSTDYVFDGKKASPYTEADPVAPLGVYGRSKLAGERAVALSNPAHVILRTSWGYSPFGGNFIKTMLRLAESRDEVSVVDDQIGNPTSTLDLADAIVKIAARITADRAGAPYGLYHMTGAGQASWADLAEAIFAASASLGGPVAKVNPIPTEQFPTPARRPANSRLSCASLARAFDVSLPHWRPSVEACVHRLLVRSTTS